MADLSTTYMGLKLKNPVIAGASGLTADMDSIKRLRDAGAAALVTKSLFEEQIQLERFKFDEDLDKANYRYAEMITVHPHKEYAGPAEHLMWVKKTKQEVDIPVIASLNAVNRETWLEYARQLEETGADALECNFFATPGELEQTGSDIEKAQVELVGELKQAVSIPVSIKLSHFYTNVLNLVRSAADAGADAFVLFNRLFEPDIDLEAQRHISPFNFSYETDYRLPLRYTGLLEGALRADICCSTGVYSGDTVVKMIMAGAAAVQTVSAVYAHGFERVAGMLRDLEAWMDQAGHAALGDFRGTLSRRHIAEPWAYTRGQYTRLLMNPEEIIENFPKMRYHPQKGKAER